MDRGRVFGQSCIGLLAKYDHATHSLRMFQPSLFGEGPELLETLPKSGMTVNGKLWEQTTWGHHTGGRESGLWPTPRAQDAKHGAATEWELNTDHAGTRDSLRVQVEHRKLGPTPTSRDHKDTGDSVRDGTVPVNGLLGRSVEGSKAGGSLNPDWVEHYLMGYPLGWTSLTSPELPKESRIVSTDSGPSETPLSQESPMKSSNP